MANFNAKCSGCRGEDCACCEVFLEDGDRRYNHNLQNEIEYDNQADWDAVYDNWYGDDDEIDHEIEDDVEEGSCYDDYDERWYESDWGDREEYEMLQ